MPFCAEEDAMRMRMTFFTAATMLAITAGSAWAQQPAPTEAAPAPDITKVNFFDLGFRGTVFSDGSDEARYQRYRDLRNGVTPDAFRYFKDSPERWINVNAEHIGYRDQQYYGRSISSASSKSASSGTRFRCSSARVRSHCTPCSRPAFSGLTTAFRPGSRTSRPRCRAW